MEIKEVDIKKKMEESSDKHLFQGIHVLGEMYGIKAELLDDAVLLESALKKGIADSGATLCGTQVKEFEPFGVTILALLSESHASIHTYPDRGALFFDAFTCGLICRPEKIAEALVSALMPTRHHLQSFVRGESAGVDASHDSSSHRGHFSAPELGT